jgi:hypothetical protein
MRMLICNVLLAGLIMMSSGCVTTGSQYYSGQNGRVDCNDFPVQSNLQNLWKDGGKNFWVSTASDVKYTGTGFGRFFQNDSSYTIVNLLTADGHTIFLHRDSRALLTDFDTVKTEANEWEELPTIESNNRRYKLQRFSLSKLEHSCIGFATYGSNSSIGYKKILYGYSCKPLSQGILQVNDVQKNLDSLQFSMW